jgi:hypothetical protein
LKANIGACSMSTTPDAFGNTEDVTLSPVIVSFVLRLPADTPFAVRLGAGVGVLSVSSSGEEKIDPLPILSAQFGAEIRLGPMFRLVGVAEAMAGDVTTGGSESYDLQGLAGIRVGMEFGF